MTDRDLCQVVTNSLLDHLRAGFETYPDDGGCFVVTPFLHFDLAAIELAVDPAGDLYRLSDEGETLNKLFVNGLTVEGDDELWREAQAIAGRYGVRLEQSALFIEVGLGELGEASLRLVNSIQAVGFLIYRRGAWGD